MTQCLVVPLEAHGVPNFPLEGSFSWTFHLLFYLHVLAAT